nr:solute carrier family 2, facilitated glucose transporter member 5-like isoform X1 [Pogona vitticeps]
MEKEAKSDFGIRPREAMDAAGSIEIVRPKRKKPKLTAFLFSTTVFSSIGMFQCGYSLWIVHSSAAIISEFHNATLKPVKEQPNELKFDDELLAVTTIMFPIGALSGLLLLGFLVDHWGRKGTLFLSNCINIACATLLGLSRSWNSYNVGIFARLLNGMSSGMFSCVVPLYIVEISPPNVRGALHVVSTWFLTMGVLMAQILGLHEALGNREGFPHLMSLVGVIAILNMVLLQFVPESPRFLLIQKGNETEARQALKMLRQKDNVEEEVEEMLLEDLCEKAEKNMNLLKLLCFRELRRHMICTIILMAGSQLTGVHGVYFYAERIYLSLGIGSKYIRFMLLGVNGGLHLVTLLVIFSIDSVGRRFLLLIGIMICSMISILLAVFLELQVKNNPSWAYISTMLVLLFLAAQMVGPAPIPYLLVGELFLQSARGSACMIGGFVNWFSRLFVPLMFIRLEPLIGPYIFLFFWPISIFIFIYIFKMIPETKGRTFVEIQKAMEMRLQKKEHRKRRAKSRAGVNSFH